MKRVVYHRLAANELVAAAVFYEGRRVNLGDEFITEVNEVRERIRANPKRGRLEKFGLRSFKVRWFPYRLFFFDEPTRLWIVAVVHLSRRPGYWRRRVS